MLGQPELLRKRSYVQTKTSLLQVYISCGGRPVAAQATLDAAGVKALCTLHIQPKCGSCMHLCALQALLGR